MVGDKIYQLAETLWPINRSLTGDGVRETLSYIQQELPEMRIHEVNSGTKVFDWVVPKEWRLKQAYIKTPTGEKICDIKQNNLHILGYSVAINEIMTLQELQQHLYSNPDLPNAIPYVTSYYAERWGFCISHSQREILEDGEYQVVIDTELFEGSLTYGELIIPGRSEKEIFLSTYICHPSMGNNELSGPCVMTYLAHYINALKDKKYTYRIVFIPETIGSITYLSRNLNHLKDHVIAGFNVTCVGDDLNYSYLPSRNGKTISDQIAQHVLKHLAPDYKSYTWQKRGSDERQYCAPGIDLPIASIMRTKYGEYIEYHSSLDDLNFISEQGLQGGYNALCLAIEALEKNCYPKIKVFGEPQLGKRGLYPTLSTKTSGDLVRDMMNLITWSDGTKSLLEIADICEIPIWKFYDCLEKLKAADLMDTFEKAQSLN